MTHPLTEILDFRLPEREILHLLLQITHLAILDLDLFHLNTLFAPSLQHPLFLARAEEQ